ncbi:MAG: flagellar hook assembly protein FlgD [Parvularculaceae bacterium]
MNDLNALQAAAPATPEPAPTSGSLASLSGDFDTFLTLLPPQLQNQDPLDPLDTESFTQQLVQFAGVEQSVETNARLDALIDLQTDSQRGAAIDLIGRSVAVAGDAAFNENGAAWRYEVADGAADVRLTIVDAAGEPLRTLDGQPGPGPTTLVWDGLDDDGAPAAPGAVRLTVEATDASDAPVGARIEAFVRVDAVDVAEDPLLITNAGAFALGDVTRVDARR